MCCETVNSAIPWMKWEQLICLCVERPSLFLGRRNVWKRGKFLMNSPKEERTMINSSVKAKDRVPLGLGPAAAAVRMSSPRPSLLPLAKLLYINVVYSFWEPPQWGTHFPPLPASKPAAGIHPAFLATAEAYSATLGLASRQFSPDCRISSAHSSHRVVRVSSHCCWHHTFWLTKKHSFQQWWFDIEFYWITNPFFPREFSFQFLSNYSQ